MKKGPGMGDDANNSQLSFLGPPEKSQPPKNTVRMPRLDPIFGAKKTFTQSKQEALTKLEKLVPSGAKISASIEKEELGPPLPLPADEALIEAKPNEPTVLSV